MYFLFLLHEKCTYNRKVVYLRINIYGFDFLSRIEQDSSIIGTENVKQQIGIVGCCTFQRFLFELS